jgi:hypothetical protein
MGQNVCAVLAGHLDVLNREIELEEGKYVFYFSDEVFKMLFLVSFK